MVTAKLPVAADKYQLMCSFTSDIIYSLSISFQPKIYKYMYIALCLSLNGPPTKRQQVWKPMLPLAIIYEIG